MPSTPNEASPLARCISVRTPAPTPSKRCWICSIERRRERRSASSLRDFSVRCSASLQVHARLPELLLQLRLALHTRLLVAAQPAEPCRQLSRLLRQLHRAHLERLALAAQAFEALVGLAATTLEAAQHRLGARDVSAGLANARARQVHRLVGIVRRALLLLVQLGLALQHGALGRGDLFEVGQPAFQLVALAWRNARPGS